MHLSDFQIAWVLGLGFIGVVAGVVFGKLIFEDLKVLAGAAKSEFSSHRLRKKAARELEAQFQLPAVKRRNTPAGRS
jgi:hypothetical protein